MGETINNLLQNGVDDGCFSRASIAVVKYGKTQFYNIGELDSVAVSENTVFDVASVTKVVPTSLLALRAIDQGLVSLSTPISDIVSTITLESNVLVTLEHLLTQSVEFPFALSQLKHLSADELLMTITEAELKSEPGTTFAYCNATSILLGLVVEELYGDSLYRLAEEKMFTPLSMKNSTFAPSEKGLSAVPTEIDSWRDRSICGEVHDESAWKLNEIMDPGAAGLFSTTHDLSKVVEMILDDNGTFLQSSFFGDCAKNWIPSVSNGETGLGFEYNQSFMGKLRSSRTIGKTGFTGSSIVMDMERKTGVVILTDYTWPHRKPNRDQIIQFRQTVADCVWQWCDDKLSL